MKAVNLIPNDLRGAGGGAGAGSGLGVYALLGGLAVVLVLLATWTLADRSVAERQTELNRVRADAETAEARAGQLEPYAKFASMRQKRSETVSSLSRTRFNWPYAIREVSRTLPSNVWLSGMVGTVAPGVTIENASTSGTQGLRNALASPAIELAGCSTGQDQVAKYMARLRDIEGVTRVSLASSEKPSGGGGSTGGGSGEDCRQGNSDIPKFELVVFFEHSTATPSAATPGSVAPTPPSTQKESTK